MIVIYFAFSFVMAGAAKTCSKIIAKHLLLLCLLFLSIVHIQIHTHLKCLGYE
jgi:hypothetical protein